MKIVFFTDTFIPEINGVVISIVNFSKGLAKKGHKVYIFTPIQNDIKLREKINLGKNINILYFKSSKFFIDYPNFQLPYPNFIKTLNLVKKINPDIIHTNSPSLHSWTAFICARILNIPIVSTYHTMLPDFLKHTQLKKISNSQLTIFATWKYTKLYYNRCDKIISPSFALKKELIKNGIKNKIEVISNGFDGNLFYPKKIRSLNNNLKILYVGRVSHEKNIDIVIKSFKMVSDKYKNVSLTIVGGGPQFKELKKLTSSLNLDNHVKFLGPIKHRELGKVYNSHDVFLTASDIETEGLVILEAMACGLPIIGVNALAVPEIVKNNKNGFIVRPNNIDEFSKAIEKFIIDKSLISKLGKKSFDISKKYSVRNSLDLLENLYKNFVR